MNNLDDIMLNERNSYKDHILCDYLYEMPRTAKSRGRRPPVAQDWEDTEVVGRQLRSTGFLLG